MSLEHQPSVPASASHAHDFYTTGGTLRHDAPGYVQRRADRELLDGLTDRQFCYVLTSRQMGKSSLMVRTAKKLREQGVSVAVVDLTAIGENLTPEQWYHGLMVRLGQLDLEDELEIFWDSNPKLGPCQRFFTALRTVVLPKLNVTWIERVERDPGSEKEYTEPGNLVVFIDEIDVVRSLPFSTDEFFAAIRECYNRRSEDEEFNRISFCLLGVATPGALIRNPRVMPFNIGRRVELNDFTAEEAAPLCGGLPSPELLDRVLYWTNGHPYLTQRLCQTIAESKNDQCAQTTTECVDQWCDELFFSRRAREKDDNLFFVRNQLLRETNRRRELLNLYLRIRDGDRVADSDSDPLIECLRLSGIIETDRDYLRLRNRIYERVFDEEWINLHVSTHVPDRSTSDEICSLSPS